MERGGGVREGKRKPDTTAADAPLVVHGYPRGNFSKFFSFQVLFKVLFTLSHELVTVRLPVRRRLHRKRLPGDPERARSQTDDRCQ